MVMTSIDGPMLDVQNKSFALEDDIIEFNTYRNNI